MTKRQKHIDDDEKRFFEYLSIPYPYKRPKAQHQKSESGKILVLADPHEPYGNETVYRAAEKHKDAEILFVAGDLGDYYSKSRFKKKHHVSFKDELRAVFFRIEWMATNWPEVRIMLGNHDNRPEKTMLGLFQQNLDLAILTEQNLLKRLASYFDNVDIVGQQLDGTGIELTHIYQLGDCLFTHAAITRAIRESMMGKISEKLFRWGKMIGLEPYSVIAQAHAHCNFRKTAGSEEWIGLPTASDPFAIGFDYIWDARMQGDPPAVGYSLFYQERGKTDLERTRNIVMEPR